MTVISDDAEFPRPSVNRGFGQMTSQRKVLQWPYLVGGPADGERATAAELMTEAPFDHGGTTYAKRKVVICEQRVLVTGLAGLSTTLLCVDLLRAILRSHPELSDEEPRSDA